MNPAALLFFLIAAIALWVTPRRWAPVALLVGCCYMTMGQSVSLGPLKLPIFRMLLIIGFTRVLVKREFAPGGRNGIDTMVIMWGAWVMFASLFHLWIPGSGPQYTSGVVLNVTLVYFLFRNWIRDADEIATFAKSLAVVLIPVALEMGQEKITGKNLFSVFGYVNESVLVRNGKLRAQGPFGHAILAGTVGATCFPLMLGIWSRHRKRAILGMGVCLFMIIASASSGPIMSLLFALGAVCLWWCRPMVAVLRWLFLLVYIAADLTMDRPAYYLISKIDITSGSTGWHRSRLMEAFFESFGEWWFAGTDFTRHWMPHGVPIGNGNHIDITNYYISFAVLGGLVSMLLIIFILVRAFSWIGKILKSEAGMPEEDHFMVWCLGAGLMAHAATSISVAYFDQSMMFFWLNIAVISALYSSVTHAGALEENPVEEYEDYGPPGRRPSPLDRGYPNAG